MSVSSIHSSGAVVHPWPLVLQVQSLGKHYDLHANASHRLRCLLGLPYKAREHRALQDVSFSLRRGQCLGVIGDNGAGKSTLLKILTGTLLPSTGRVHISGNVTAILELGAGFHPEFTGRENLSFAGRLMGLSDHEIQGVTPWVLEFSQLGEAIDRPVKTYSSGMLVRLAFAMVTAKQPDLLIIDEALAVGDQHFQRKCVQRIETFREAGCSILFCSHSMYHVRQICDHVMWLDHGQVRQYGLTQDVLAAYELENRLAQISPLGSGESSEDAVFVAGEESSFGPAQSAKHRMPSPGAAGLLSVTVAGLVVTEPDNQVNQLKTSSDGSFVDKPQKRSAQAEPPLLGIPDLCVTLKAQMPPGEAPQIGLMIEQAHGVGITSVATHFDGVRPRETAPGLWEVQLCFEQLSLHTGEYVLSAYLFDEAGLIVHDEWKNCVHLRHRYAQSPPGLVSLPHRWS